jgi:CBS domain-containing protein
MYLVSELLRHKGSLAFTIGPGGTALEAAQEMNRHRVGSLVVTERGKVVGIVTERDILTKIVAAERTPHATPVREIMTARVLTCAPETPLDELRRTMRERRVRHVPVVEGGALVGMASLGDLNLAEAQTLTETIGYLEAYISR